MTVLLSIGAAAALLLAAGAANLPYAGPLRWRAASPAGWASLTAPASLARLEAPYNIPPGLPFTLEISARAANDGGFWGVWLDTPGTTWQALVSADGYLSVGTDSHPHWFEFMHLLPAAPNRLYLHVDGGGVAALRINDELAWAGALAAPLRWGVVSAGGGSAAWDFIRLYHK